ncbi:hypothetical protein EG329_011292 [Mollisiaceae sp. DMI_Dod_QoI]|nr:hypothetical protein EG329_011292 [Helotiales sp. DMI_Dod_QoI]
MPKRKRSGNDEDSGDRIIRRRKQAVQDELTRSKKLLHRALKTAKGFERQKLGKRLKVATTNNVPEEVKRINNEIEALKTLDLDKVTVAQLHRCLLKVKEFRDSELLPEEVSKDLPKPKGSEEEIKAMHNVTSGMCNAKVVREEIARVLGRMYAAMGIHVPVKEPQEKQLKKEEDNNADINGRDTAERKVSVKVDKRQPSSKPEENEDDNANINNGDRKKRNVKFEMDEGQPLANHKDNAKDEEDVDSWEGFDSNKENEGQEEHDDQESLDEEELQQYDALLGASSDEESFHKEDWLPKERPEQTRFSFSPSPSLLPSISASLSPSPSPELSPEVSPEPEPEARPKKASKAKPAPTKAGKSTFLPSLMGGYWSGSESEASDLEDARPFKKNRPGQMARRAIWEKKYGEKANHIKTGQGPVAARGKDDGWDPKRGAKDTSGTGRGRGGGSTGRGGARVMNRKERRSLVGGTGENATPIMPRTEAPKKRDDVGILHPSWQAAKKAKEMKQSASFQGKKVTFD